MSRSELLSRAARYLEELDAKSATDKSDLALASFGPSDDSAADAVTPDIACWPRRPTTGQRGGIY